MEKKKINPRRKFILSLAAGLATGVVCPLSAFAGAWTGGSTEVTQMRNELELIFQFELQVEQYVRQGLQFQTQLTNLIKNPLSLLGSEVGGMINKIGEIMSVGNSIGSTIAQIDKNFGTMFKNPGAISLANGFTKWHATSIDTLEGALKSAGLQNQRFEDETEKIQALYDKAANTGGALAALQALASINSHQLKQMQGLGQLIATQNIAASTYMAEQTSQTQMRVDKNEEIQKGFIDVKPKTPPALEKTKNEYKQFDFYK